MSSAVAACLLAAANLGAVARPALRLGGEWAGWRCGFDPYSGALRTGSSFKSVTTERWAGTALERRSVELPPDDGEARSTTRLLSRGRRSVSGWFCCGPQDSTQLSLQYYGKLY